MNFNQTLKLLENEEYSTRTGTDGWLQELRGIVGEYSTSKRRNATQYAFARGKEQKVLDMLKRRFKNEKMRLKDGEYIWDLENGLQVVFDANKSHGNATILVFK